jgi:hypothetical protein
MSAPLNTSRAFGGMSAVSRVSGKATPAARYARLSGSTAPWQKIGPMAASTPARMRCALPNE